MAKKVLIIDDSLEDVNAVASIFKNSNIELLDCSNPFSAIDMIYKEAPDLIVLDILMPELGGYELCRMIKSDEFAKDIPVVMYSKLDKNIDKFWAFRSGANGFVNKGELTSEFLKTITNTMENIPVSLETKGKLLNSKQRSSFDDNIKNFSKENLVRDFNSIKEVYTDADILAIRIFGTIYRYFKYDCAMIAFKDKEEENILYFDTENLSLSRDVFNEIEKKIPI